MPRRTRSLEYVSSRLVDRVPGVPPTYNIEHEAYESMMGCKWQKHLINQHNMLEVVNHTLPVQEVHCGGQPIPVQRFCEFQSSSPAGNICNCNDLFERDDLNCGHNSNDVDVAHEHSIKERADHNECPY